MRQVSSGAEFYEEFMWDYIFWGDKQKTLTMLRELTKLSILGIIAFFLIPTHLLIIGAIWMSILTRSKFVQIMISVSK